MAEVIKLESPRRVERELEEMIRLSEVITSISFNTEGAPPPEKWAATIEAGHQAIARADEFRRYLAATRKPASDEEITQRLMVFVGCMKRPREMEVDTAVMIRQMQFDIMEEAPSAIVLDRALRILRTEKCEWLPGIAQILSEIRTAKEFYERVDLWLGGLLPGVLRGAEERKGR